MATIERREEIEAAKAATLERCAERFRPHPSCREIDACCPACAAARGDLQKAALAYTNARHATGRARR